MKLNFCTLFDSNFIISGYTMYTSLKKHCKNFHLYIFAFDDLTYNVLTRMALSDTTIIPLSEFEDEELLKVKPTRNKGEYCWTCTASTIKYCIGQYQLDHCTYLDADLYFYKNPEDIVTELLDSGKDVLITDHNYAFRYDQSKFSGQYCVQFMVFRNTNAGMKVLDDWRNSCIDWCYARIENGKFGDQKYLDNWLIDYNCVLVSSLLGAGLAPWNVTNYKYDFSNQEIKIKTATYQQKLYFYHFHQFKMYKDKAVWGTEYFLPDEIQQYIYTPYTNLFLENYNYLHEKDNNIVLQTNDRITPKSFGVLVKLFMTDILRFFYLKIKGLRFNTFFNTYYIYRIKDGRIIKS